MTAAIFNSAKTIEEYKNTPIFMGPEPGFMDTIYKNHPKLWNLYKELKALDWSEDEFDFTRCLLDFKNCHQDTSDMMIETIGWQWEADSVAGEPPKTLESI
jgi:ribonucleoside-diphosphate reductase beta chain